MGNGANLQNAPKHLGIRPTITARGHRGSRAIKKSRRLLSSMRLKLFEELILVVEFKANPIVDLDGSFRDSEH